MAPFLSSMKKRLFSDHVPLQNKHRSKAYGSEHMHMLRAMLDDGLISQLEYEEKLERIEAHNHEVHAESTGINFMPWSQKSWLTEQEAHMELDNIKFGGTRLRWRLLYREGRQGLGQRPLVYQCCLHDDCPVRAKISALTCSGGFGVAISMGVRHTAGKELASVRANARMTFEQEVSRLRSYFIAFLRRLTGIFSCIL